MQVKLLSLNEFMPSLLQGGPGCEYCRITRSDVRRALGFNSIEAFGSKLIPTGITGLWLNALCTKILLEALTAPITQLPKHVLVQQMLFPMSAPCM